VEKRKYLVIVDPSHERHIALERMLDIINQMQESMLDFHLLIGFEGADKSDPNAPDEVVRSSEWISELLKPLNDAGVEYTSEFFWTSSWRESILKAADRQAADVIMLCESSAENKLGITDSKWDLVRRAKCDVVIVDEGTKAPIKCILAAVKTQATDEGRKVLNGRILERGKFLADYFKADFHVVNAYKGSEDFPDRELIKRMTGLPRENIHRDMGKPDEVIADMVSQVNADMVVLGFSTRKGLSAKFSSHTSEGVMEKITVDVVALN
jgi:universal stress protein E